MGTKANQMMQVVYIVNPMNLDSLNASGMFRVNTAYTVHTTVKNETSKVNLISYFSLSIQKKD